MKGHRYGPDAWLLSFATVADRVAFLRGEKIRRALEARPPRGLLESVPSFTTLLCRFEPGTAPVDGGWWDGLGRATHVAAPAAPREIEIPMRYDGEDLELVAGHHGVDRAEVVRLHAAGSYFVHCLGFAPGFAYLGGLDTRLHTPRRAVPRMRVLAGSVAIGGEHAGVYGIPSPGGWNLIGNTTRRLFDPEGSGPDAFLLSPGDSVRFVETSVSMENPDAMPSEEPAGTVAFTVLSTGTGVTVQDRGRAGWARFGVPVGGAMDVVSLERANRLIDNPPEAAALELALGRQEFRAEADLVVGIAGADLGAVVSRAGGTASEPVPAGHTLALRSGDRLRFAGGRRGVWAYLALPGGVVSRASMGSQSSMPRAGIGVTLATGSLVRIGTGASYRLPSGTVGRRVPWDGGADAGETVVRAWPGPQARAFDASTVRRWFETPWRVSAQSDRVGYRLEGEALAVPGGDMISEPVLPGTVQVPPGGQPIVTMADGPTMGGYAKLALVDPRDLPRLSQCAPGTMVRFVAVEDSGWGESARA